MMDLHKKAIPLRRVAFLIVGPPPGLSKKRAIAKLIGNSLRRTSSRMCVLRQDFPRGEPKVKRLEEIYGVSVV